MTFQLEPYLSQLEHWPRTGRHILAQFDDASIVVYQAYRPAIGHFAAANRFFGGEFSLSRMSWIKPNFLWMMYRCGWATKKDQEVVLAVRLKREGFDQILARAVHSLFVPEVYASHEAWAAEVAASDVRLQWDPDHDPTGAPQERRAIQLGLRGDTLRGYSREWIIDIEDISAFVREQAAHMHKDARHQLLTPRERVYPVHDINVAARLGMSAGEGT